MKKRKIITLCVNIDKKLKIFLAKEVRNV